MTFLITVRGKEVKMKTLFICFAVAGLISVGLVRGNAQVKTEEKNGTADMPAGMEWAEVSMPEPETVSGKPELMAIVETRETAEQLAETYGITLAEYHEDTMIAMFWNTSGMRLTELIRYGEANGLPPIEVDHANTAY